MRTRLAAGAAATAAATGLCAANERVVEQRTNRLERLRVCADAQPRVAADDVAAQRSMAAPIVVRGLMDKWPAMQEDSVRSWTFANLRQRMGQTLVDTGSASGGVPFYLVAHNATAPGAGRHDLALYIFDSNFESDATYESLLSDWSPLSHIAHGDVFASQRAAEHDDRPSWRWLLAGPPGSGTIVHQDPWGYSSWNASCVGVKRWCFFPPSVSRDTLHPPRHDLVGRLSRWLVATVLTQCPPFHTTAHTVPSLPLHCSPHNVLPPATIQCFSSAH
jgi:hypothetical protein